MPLQIRLLGPLEVVVGGEPVRITGRPAAVLAVLAMSANRIVSLDRLVTATWGDTLPGNPRASLQTIVTRLRRLIGTDRIENHSAGYLLRATQSEVDAQHFIDLLDRAASTPDTGQEHRLLIEALTLWRGTPFEGVSPAWLAQSQAPALVERYLTAFERRIDLDLAQGRDDGQVAQLHDLIARHPLRESLWVRLLGVLDATGRRAEALEHYEAVRRQIADELGADPGPQLRAMHARLLADDSPPDTPAPAEPAGGLVPRQLPPDLAGFVGREPILATMDSRLGGGTTPLVITAIGGAAGIGKTTLAVHWAHRVADRFPDGQLYANLRGFDPSGSPRPPEEVLRGFLDALQVQAHRVPTGLEAQVGLYRSLLAGRRMLIVLDNARDAEQVRPLLPGSPGSQVVVTSRDRLTSLVAVQGAQLVILDVLSTREAQQLLERRLGAERVVSDPQATERIIRRCAGLPLALAVVAARAIERPDTPLAALAAELDGARAELDAFADTDPMIDVRAVFSWSYRTLSLPAARLFRLLSVHPGPDVPARAAAAVAGLPLAQTRSLLRELLAAHMISQPAADRYTFHDLLRAYSGELAEQIDPGADRHEARLRTLDHYVHTAYQAALLLNPLRRLPALDGLRTGVLPPELADRGAAMEWLTAEYQCLQRLIEWVGPAEFDRHVARLAIAMTGYMDLRGQWDDTVRMQLAALDAVRRLGDPMMEMTVRRRLTRAYTMLHRHEEAEAQAQQTLEIARTVGDPYAQAQAHHQLAFLLDSVGRYAEALGQVEQELRLAREAGLPHVQALALNGIGWFNAQLGNLDLAVEACEEAIEIDEKNDIPSGLASSCDTLAYVHHRRGDLDKAIEGFARSARISRQLGDLYALADTLTRFGDAYVAAGDAASARAVWQESLEIFTALERVEAARIRAKLDELQRTPAA